MLKWFLSTYNLFLVTVALTRHGVRAEHYTLDPRRPLPENAAILDQEGTSTIIRTARLRESLPIFEFTYGRSSEYELGRALEEFMIIRGRPLSTMVYNVEPDLAMFNWMGYDK
ncbi:hypothetical protein OPQ81_006205 [Rhizoctonia solani]|nr:hypothetical protein OPQ81_006205 [Rhizoctonia solani]